jgi:ATP-binding cassette subfamily B protein
VGVVLQDSFCFRGTVAGNIAYGRPEAAREQIEQAAAAVGAHDVLSAVPGGFDGLVEEEGRNLTAAQRQMIGLTRAWLAAPDCLVLDEATSTLDADLEQRVLEAVRRLGRTTVFVTHRLSVARQADLVVLVDQGKLVQSGTHKKLVGTKGAYADLWATGPEVGDGALAGAKAGAARARRRRA